MKANLPSNSKSWPINVVVVVVICDLFCCCDLCCCNLC